MSILSKVIYKSNINQMKVSTIFLTRQDDLKYGKKLMNEHIQENSQIKNKERPVL